MRFNTNICGIIFILVCQLGVAQETYFNDLLKIDDVIPDGDYDFYYKGGGIHSSYTVKNGHYNGRVIYFFRNGKVYYQYDMKNGMLNGKLMYFYDNGKVHTSLSFVDNNLEGRSVYFDKLERLKYEVFAEQDTVKRRVTYHYKGNSKTVVQKDEWTRTVASVAVLGDKLMEYLLFNSKAAFTRDITEQYCNRTYLNSNGSIKSMGAIQNGEKDGEWKYFRKNGELQKVEKF